MNVKFWQEMRNKGLVLVDTPDRKLAIYANQLGLVVLATHEDGNTHICTIDPSEIGRVTAALLSAQVDAQELSDEIDTEYRAHLAINKAMGTT